MTSINAENYVFFSSIGCPWNFCAFSY